MGWLDRARTAVTDLFHRDRFEREVDEELQGFLDLAGEENERAGASPSEARRSARASFGGVEACKEHVRDARIGAVLDSVVAIVRIAAVAKLGLRRSKRREKRASYDQDAVESIARTNQPQGQRLTDDRRTARAVWPADASADGM